MKRVKNLIICSVLLAFIACSDDERGLSFLLDVPAPANLSVALNVTQDNTGLVTLTPNAEGAQEFELNYGDNSGTITLIPGESTEHIYEEGNYEIGLIAKAVNGLTTEITQNLVVSFIAPQNLVVTIENDPALSKTVNINATAEYAVYYEVDFGEDPDADPVSSNIGEGISYTYEEAGIYTISVTAFGAAIETTTYTEDFEVTAILAPLVSAPTPPDRAAEDVISLFTTTYTNVPDTDFFPDWGQAGCCGSGWALFDLDGDEMLQYSNLSYQGNQLAAPIDVSGMEYIHLDVWTADVLQTIEISLISLTNGERPVVIPLTPNDWTSIDIPITDYTDQDGFTVADIHQLKYVGDPFAGGGTAFVDNIYFYKSPTVETTPSIPIDFESTVIDYAVFSFGAADFGPIPTAIIDNPDPTGVNTTAKVLEVHKTGGAQVWAGAGMSLTGPIDFSDGTTINVDVWSPNAGTPILFKLEDSTSPPDGNGNPTIIAEVIVNTTTAAAWETLSFDLTTFGAFSTSNNYDRVIVFPNFGNGGADNMYYFDNFAFDGVTTAPGIPVDFESILIDYGIFSFGASDFGPIPASIISNPDPDGINTSAKVFEVVKTAGAQVWAGAGINLDGPVNFANGTTITIDVWSPSAGMPILFKMEDSNSPPDGNGNPSIFVEVIVNTSVANAWETLSFDLTTFGAFDTANSYDRAIVFPNFGNGGNGETFYFDNIQQTN